MSEKIYGLVGEKLGHSFSPQIHRALGNEDYRLYELTREELQLFLQQDDLGGVNVTIPYKIDAYGLCDVLSEAAKEIGAVNTLVRRDGKLWGYNTDQLGLLCTLKKAHISLQGKKVLILGSGGSSRMAQWVSEKCGAANTVVISRSGENNYSNLSLHSDARIIINTTPVGMYPKNGEEPLCLSSFPKLEGVVDLIYNPLKTELLMEAERRKIPCIGGLHMLVAQAVASAELFFDKKQPENALQKVEAMLQREMTNLVLIGMPGGGKSTIGRRLGQLTGREVLETDAIIEERAGKTISEIFAQDGEQAFREIESRVIRDCGKRQGCILVTGGGVVTRPENYEPLHQNGRIYEISRDVEKLARRGRPLSTDVAALKKMAWERSPMYRRFRDRRIYNYGSKQQVAEKIWRDFLENTGD